MKFNPFGYVTEVDSLDDEAPSKSSSTSPKTKTGTSKVKSTGGPTGYYDFLSGWVTLNDLLEYKAVTQWGAVALHMKDIMKACYRFGGKEGTEAEYDSNKIIYFGCRILLMLKGKEAVRKYLKSLLEDPQFK